MDLFTLQRSSVVALEVLGLLTSGSSASHPLQRLSGLVIATLAHTDLLSATASGRVVALGIPGCHHQPVMVAPTSFPGQGFSAKSPVAIPEPSYYLFSQVGKA